MKRVLEFHIAVSLALAILLYSLRSSEAAIAFIFGSSVSFFNLLALAVVWPWILAKKLVALSIGIIVIKFAILGWILYEVATKNLVQVEWFAVGLGVVILTVLSASYFLPKSFSPSLEQ
jgi:hypothetical protein